MKEPEFVVLPASKWLLRSDIAEERRRSLLHPPNFVEIVEQLRQSVRLRSARCERSSKNPWTRVKAVLYVPPELGVLVDQYHNGASGVRAQCLKSIDLGDLALDVARDALRSRALELISTRGCPKPSMTMVEASLKAESSKVWIYQGLWVRRAKADARDLLVATWHEPAGNQDAKIRNLVRYGSKAPSDEHRIEVIGGWLDDSGTPRPGKEPGLRATQIHRYGFT